MGWPVFFMRCGLKSSVRARKGHCSSEVNTLTHYVGVYPASSAQESGFYTQTVFLKFFFFVSPTLSEAVVSCCQALFCGCVGNGCLEAALIFPIEL